MSYTPTEWGNKAPNLTPELMNKLEQGVADHTEDTDNPHNVTKEQVGLDKVDNTSDADKPVSTATEELIDTTKDELTESTTKDMVELKMLGWTVPKDCPIQNSISGSTFIQNVGRVNLGRLLWGYVSSAAQPFFYVDLPNVKIGSNKGYCSEYVLSESTTYGGMTDKGFRFALASENRSRVYVKDTAYTDATAIQIANKTTYLYYELATPVTKNIDGNEVVDKMTSTFGPLVKNFLAPNSVIHGDDGNGYINITDEIEIGRRGFNGYYLTISGEVASDVSYKLCSNVKLRQSSMGKAVKFVGCLPTGGPDKYFFRIYDKYTKKTYYDYGEGVIIPIENSSPRKCDIYLEIKAGTPTIVEDVFYPVLSNDLSIDYTIGDVPYLGLQKTLIQDLSAIQENASKGYDAYDIATNAQTIATDANARAVDNSNEISSIKDTLNNGLVSRLELSKMNGNLAKIQIDFLNVGNKKIVLQGQVSGKVGTYFSVANNDVESITVDVDDTTAVPEPITKLLYSSQGTFRSKIVGSILISNAVASDGTKSIIVAVTFNGSYSFDSANVASGMVYFHF